MWLVNWLKSLNWSKSEQPAISNKGDDDDFVVPLKHIYRAPSAFGSTEPGVAETALSTFAPAAFQLHSVSWHKMVPASPKHVNAERCCLYACTSFCSLCILSIYNLTDCTMYKYVPLLQDLFAETFPWLGFIYV